MKSESGSSKLELLAAITVIAVFGSILLNRLWFYQEVAEKAKVEYTISILRSTLRIQMAEMMSEGRAGELALLEQKNPLDWLEEKPVSEVLGATAAESEKNASGVWQFDSRDRTLTYWPVRKEHFQADRSGQKRIRLRVELVHDAPIPLPQGNITTSINHAAVIGLRLQVEPYSWLQ